MGRPQLQPGQTLGSYRIVRKVGQGGMGEVYEAWDPDRHRRVAIKVLKTEPWADGNPDLETIERFRNEGRALARLRSENVVALFTVGEFHGRVFMAMEYVDGVPLDHFMMSHACALADLIELFRQMAQGLSAAHKSGILHRDLKPANVVIDRRMTAKLVDFGVAKIPDKFSLETSQGVVIGTVNYLSPEVAAGKPASQQSDIYSLGLVFFHMLTGVVPFVGRSNFETLEKIRTTYLVFGPRLQQLIPDGIKRIVDRMTHKAPNQRYSTAEEVLADLNQLSLAAVPVDLRESKASGFPIGNYTEVRKRCESLGFDSGEIRFVMAVAAGVEVETSRPLGEESTDKIEVRPVIEISEPSLSEGVRRYNKAKAVQANRVHAQQPNTTQYQIHTANESSSFASVLATILLGFSLYYAYQVARAHLPVLPSPGAAAAVREVAATSPATVGLRPLTPGTTLNFSGGLSWTVESLNADSAHWRTGDGGHERRSLSPFLPAFEAADLRTQISGDPLSLFPLSLGHTSTHRIQVQQGAKHWQYDQTCIVGRESRIDLQSGSFQVVQVECATTTGVRDVYLFAPSLGYWVERRRSSSAGQEVVQLTGYRLAP
jgi:serine/threonine protein kinase